MNILAMKLTTTEELLAEIESEDETHFVLCNPVRIAILPGANGQPSVGFAPFPTHGEQRKDMTLSIAKKFVVYYYTPAEEYISNYKQAFGVGIVLPPQQIITG